MRIDQLPALPQEALSANVPCTYNGADYQTPMNVNQSGQFYQSGERISQTLYGFGFVTNSRRQLVFTVIVPKAFLPDATITVQTINASIRCNNGGYIESSINANLTSIFSSANCAGTALTLLFSSTSELHYGIGGTASGVVTNNTPCCGYITLNATVN